MTVEEKWIKLQSYCDGHPGCKDCVLDAEGTPSCVGIPEGSLTGKKPDEKEINKFYEILALAGEIGTQSDEAKGYIMSKSGMGEILCRLAEFSARLASAALVMREMVSLKVISKDDFTEISDEITAVMAVCDILLCSIGNDAYEDIADGKEEVIRKWRDALIADEKLR